MLPVDTEADAARAPHSFRIFFPLVRVSIFLILLALPLLCADRSSAQTGAYAPTGLTASSLTGSVQLNWNAADNASSYNIYEAAKSGGEGTTPVVSGVTATNYSVTGLTNGTVYYFTVTAVSAMGESYASSEAAATPGSTVLPAPVLTDTGSATAIKLSWSAVSGAASYDVFRSTTNSNFHCYLKGITTPTFTDTSLAVEQTYYYEVAAVSVAGEGAVSNSVIGVAGFPLPNAPTNLRAVAQNNSVVLNWNGISQAATYDLYRSTASGGEGSNPIAIGINQASYTDSTAVNGTTYYYTVAAAGSAGISKPSNEASANPNSTALAAPILTLAPGNQQNVLKWSAVTGATAYDVMQSVVNTGSYLSLSSGVTGTTYTATGLTNGLSYYYYVSAIGASGQGSASNTAVGIPGGNPPQTPTGLRGYSVNNSYIQLFWNPQLDVSAGQFNIYRSTAPGGEGTVPYATSAGVSYGGSYYFNDSAALSDQQYYYKITAANGGGESPQSAEVGASYNAYPVLPAPALTATSGPGQVTLKWSPVAPNTGSVTYDIYRVLPGGSTASLTTGVTSTTYADTSGGNGIQYNYTVAAADNSGQGATSNTVSGTAGGTALPAPVITVVAATGSDSVYWTPVPGATGYAIFRSTSSAMTGVPLIATVGNVFKYADKNSIVNGTTYYYQVEAIDTAGFGAASNIVAATPATSALLKGPSITSATPGSTQVALTWATVSGASGFDVYYSTDNSTWELVQRAVTTNSFTVQGLTNFVLYYFAVGCIDSTGDGPIGGSSKATPVGATFTAPTNLIVRAHNYQGQYIFWDPVIGATSYNIYRGLSKGGEGATPFVTGINAASYYYLDQGLIFDQAYYYQVTALNGTVESPRSNEANGTPGPAQLPAPVLFGAPGSSVVNLSWALINGSSYYHLYRSAGGAYSCIAILTGKISTYTDAAVTAGQTYSYQLAGMTSYGEGSLSNTVNLMPGAPGSTPPAAPFGLEATPSGTTGAYLYWNPEAGVSSYNVYMGDSPGGEARTPLVAGIGATADSESIGGLLPNHRYYFKLTAVSGSDESAPSNEASAKTGLQQLPAPNLRALASAGSVTLNWTQVPGAKFYMILRSTDNSYFAVLVTNQASGTTAYTDTAVVNGITYYYRVCGATVDGYGVASNTASATPKDGLPSVPLALAAIPNNGYVSLNWTPASANATGFNLYRSITTKAPSSPYATFSNQTTYNDSGVTNGTTYYYWVTATNAVGESGRSPMAQADPGSSIPPAPFIEGTAGNDQNTIDWNSVPGATGYMVSRYTAGAWNLITSAPVAGNTYSDLKLTNGVTYDYYVQAVTPLGWTASSNQISLIPGVSASIATNIASTASSNSVTIAFANVPGAGGYSIFRGTASAAEQPYTAIATPTSAPFATWTDPAALNGATYYYEFAPNVDGSASTLSNETMAAPPAAGNPDFVLAATPTAVTVGTGGNTVVTVSFDPVNDFNGTISLSLSGAPAGVSAVFYPQIATVSGSYLNLAVAANTATGTYPMIVTAQSGTITRTYTVTLTVVGTIYGDVRSPAFWDDAAKVDRLSRLSPSSGDGSPRQPRTILNDIGNLAQPVPEEDIASWRRDLHTGAASGVDAALRHVWLGEYALGQQKDPEAARAQFACVGVRQPEDRDAGRWETAYGLSRYDNALALFYEGAFFEAKNAFQDLLAAKEPLSGFDRRLCAQFARRASACYAYHAAHARIGIPEPPRLDPLCGAASLAVSLRSMSLPWDKAHVAGLCAANPEGSSLGDLVNAGARLGVDIQPLTADRQGLIDLPKPLVAYVERDHFVSVVDADASGVTYICSDCGAWPGGRVHLNWSQWACMDSSTFATVTRHGSPLSRNIADALAIHAHPGRALLASAFPSERVASIGPLPSLLSGFLATHIAPLYVARTGTVCGSKPDAPKCSTETCCPTDNGGTTCAWEGASDGDPVNLATGEEDYAPPADINVYNPDGPSIAWSRMYGSLRAILNPTAYQFNDYGAGWSESYCEGVYDPSPTSSGTKYIFYPNGSRHSFSAPSVPTSTNPTVPCSVSAGVAEIVTWNYSASLKYGYYTITFRDRTSWTTTGWTGSPADSYVVKLITDRNGNSIRFNYISPVDANGWPLITSIDDPAHSRTLLTINRANDGTGNIASITDFTGRTVFYHEGYYPTLNVPSNYPQGYEQVDAVSELLPSPLLSSTPPSRYSLGYYEDTNTEGVEQVPFLHEISVPSPTGDGMSTATINYDPKTAYVSSLVDANGNTRSYSSTGLSTTVTVTNPSNQTVYTYTAGYDNNMDSTTVTNGSGQTTQTSTYSDPNDPYTPSSVEDANGNATQYTWDQFGNPLTMTSPRGTVTTNAYSYTQFSLGELASSRTGAKSPTTYAYVEPSGLLKTVTAPAPGTAGSSQTVAMSFTYDSLGNMLTVVKPGNNATSTATTTYNYTADGTYSQADAIRQPLTITDPLGHVAHYRYDSRGNTIAEIDALGNETDHSYNIADQITQVTYPATGQSGSGRAAAVDNYLYVGGPQLSASLYDESGNKLQETQYGYGPEGEMLSKTGGSEPVFKTYDALYRLASVSDADAEAAGKSTAFSYNPSGFLASVTFPDGTSTSYPSYDALGNALQRVDGRGIVTNYAYADPENRLTGIQYPASTAINVGYAYDSYGRRSSMTDETGKVTYAYDDNDLETSVITTYTGLTAQTIGYKYYADGTRSTMTTPAGSFTYNYDATGRETGIKNPFSETTQYSYYNNDMLGGWSLANGVTAAYSYNARNFATDLLNKSGSTVLSEFGSTSAPSSAIQYDSAGNPTSITANMPGAASFGGTTTYQYDSAGQMQSEKSTRNAGYTNSFVYDPAGNPTTFKGQANTFNVDSEFTDSGFKYDHDGNPTTYAGAALQFDAENRLTGISASSFSAGYTGDNLRAWSISGGVKTYYLRDGATPVVELSSTGSITAVNTFGVAGLISRHISSGSVFFSYDPQGNLAEQTGPTGTLLASAIFDSYGHGAVTGSPVSSPFGFDAQYGYYTDAATGLVLCGLRYYDPGEGRWLTRDPVGYGGGANLYAYASNSPTSQFDPSGALSFPSISRTMEIWRDGKEAYEGYETGSRIGGGVAAGAMAYVDPCKKMEHVGEFLGEQAGSALSVPVGLQVGFRLALLGAFYGAEYGGLQGALVGGLGGFAVGYIATTKLGGWLGGEIGGSIGGWIDDVRNENDCKAQVEAENAGPMPGDVPIGDGLVYNDLGDFLGAR